MNTSIIIEKAMNTSNGKKETKRGKITVFHCFNTVENISAPENEYDVNSIKLPCSGMTSDKVLLKAFEDGADAVAVLACPENTCRYLQGNLKARKRVERVKKLLNEAGLDGEKLNFYNIKPGDDIAVQDVIRRTADNL